MLHRADLHKQLRVNTSPWSLAGGSITSVGDTLHGCVNEWRSSTVGVQVDHVDAGLVSSVVVHQGTTVRQAQALSQTNCTHQASPSFTLTFAGLGLDEPFSGLLGSPPVTVSAPARPLISTFRFMASTALGDRSFAMTYLARSLSFLRPRP